MHVFNTVFLHSFICTSMIFLRSLLVSRTRADVGKGEVTITKGKTPVPVCSPKLSPFGRG